MRAITSCSGCAIRPPLEHGTPEESQKFSEALKNAVARASVQASCVSEPFLLRRQAAPCVIWRRARDRYPGSQPPVGIRSACDGQRPLQLNQSTRDADTHAA